MLPIVTLTLALRVPAFTRRGACLAATAAVTLPGHAYDSVPTIKPDFEQLEKKRLAREALEKKNEQRIKPYLDEISAATTPQQYADGCDKLAVWIIGEGTLPTGIDPAAVRDVVQDTYEALPQVGYSCEKTRTNNGVCYSPGLLADDANKATSIIHAGAQTRGQARRSPAPCSLLAACVCVGGSRLGRRMRWWVDGYPTL